MVLYFRDKLEDTTGTLLSAHIPTSGVPLWSVPLYPENMTLTHIQKIQGSTSLQVKGLALQPLQCSHLTNVSGNSSVTVAAMAYYLSGDSYSSIQLLSSILNIQCDIRIMGNGQIYYGSNGGYNNSGRVLSIQNWYYFKIVWDSFNRRYSAYYRHSAISSWTSICSNVPYYAWVWPDDMYELRLWNILSGLSYWNDFDHDSIGTTPSQWVQASGGQVHVSGNYFVTTPHSLLISDSGGALNLPAPTRQLAVSFNARPGTRTDLIVGLYTNSFSSGATQKDISQMEAWIRFDSSTMTIWYGGTHFGQYDSGIAWTPNEWVDVMFMADAVGNVFIDVPAYMFRQTVLGAGLIRSILFNTPGDPNDTYIDDVQLSGGAQSYMYFDDITIGDEVPRLVKDTKLINTKVIQ